MIGILKSQNGERFGSCRLDEEISVLDKSIGEADRRQFVAVRDPREWKNPFLLINADGTITLITSGAQEKTIDGAGLHECLLKLAPSDSPFGRVVSIRPCSVRSENKEQFEEEDRLLKATWGQMRQALRSLGVEMNMWPLAVSSHELVARAVSSTHALHGMSNLASQSNPTSQSNLSNKPALQGDAGSGSVLLNERVDLPPIDEMKRFMREAMREAQASSSEGGYPSGSVLVQNDKVVARGHNKQLQHLDLTAHAEIDCLRQADFKVDFRTCVLYSTVKPCPMCLGAARQFGIPLVVAGSRIVATASQSDTQSQSGNLPFVANCLEEECHELVSNFLLANPDKLMLG